MKKRIVGIDVARAFAIVGMIIVNFKIVFGMEGNTTIKYLASFLEGKAAALFVVLAGIGIAFMSNRAVASKDKALVKKTRKRIAKRALFLFVVGTLYLPLWIADILHFYGVYMLITLLLLTSSPKWIFRTAILLILVYPLLMFCIDYETSWNFKTFHYADFWTAQGFCRNLFYNGFHPVIPWTAFMLIGLWFGKKDLNDSQFVKKSLWRSLGIFIGILLLSKASILLLSEGNVETVTELGYILGTSPMPPLPFYMFAGSSLAVFIICCCILLAKRFENNFLIDVLKRTGQLALTFYVAHVILGMGIMFVLYPGAEGTHTITFSVGYALVFSVCCMVFAYFWTNYKKSGPLEWLMRKITD